MKLTNYYIHPNDNRYLVFEFAEKSYADHFENLLKNGDCWFERHQEDDVVFFGVEKSKSKEVMNMNFRTYGHFRNPMITNGWYKYLLLIITFIFIIFALVGYYKSR